MSAEIRRGVLLFNLGTPEAPERAAVARYLREFLSDPRVVDLPRWFWLPLLYGVIVPLRAGRSARAYAKVWREEGSPLLHLSRRLTQGLQRAAGDGTRFALGMRYGKPSIHDALAELRSLAVESLTVLPLYPQFSYTTTASGYDAVDEALDGLGWDPPQHRMRDYHQHPAWVAAIAASIGEFRQRHGTAERLLFSLHGIPERYVAAGDPYQTQCEASASAIARELGLADGEWMLTFQSRLGREPWLQPYTDQTLEALPEEGVRRIQAVCPGFAVDCLETLEEMAMENDAIFREAGGEKLEYIPCLNDSERHVRALLQIINDAK